jgi:mono/diheme cytochrome c family protein
MRSLRLLALAAAFAVAVPAAAQSENSQVSRGLYLSKIMGCNDCHTPFKLGPKGPEPDMSRTLSGHPQDMTMPPPPPLAAPWVWMGAATNTAFAGPWGVSFTANLTPDPETGLGKWSEKMFMDAIRTGKHQGIGRPILPPMPWPMYRHATDEDLKALFAYLRSIPAIKNRVAQPVEPPAAPAAK